MSNGNENTASAASAVKMAEVPTTPTSNDRQRTPRLGLVIVFDGDHMTVEVHHEKDPQLARLSAQGYCALKIPSRCRQVTIFVDPETEAIPTTESATDGLYNVVLARLYFDHLGKYHRFLRFLGLLTTLYVLHPASWAESSSRTSTGSFHGRE